MDGQAAVVAAGEQQTHRSRLPVTIAFDRGGGKESAEMTLSNGTYKVGVSPDSNLWDLLYVPPDDQPPS